MRVVIEVVAGPLTGRKFHLVRNQRLEFGSTAQAEVCVRGDSQLAPLQFALETDHQACRVRDLCRQGTTLLNGQAVELAVLRDGDEVQAGASRFTVRVEGDEKNLPAELVAAKPSALKASRRAPNAAYDQVACDTGLTRYGGSCAQFPPAELAAALAEQWPLYFLADNRRLQDDALRTLKEPHYLFDWLGAAAPQLSPVVVLPGEVADAAGLVERGWRRDGLACFFAKEAGEAPFAALRKSARADGDRVVGICWPSILSYLLSHYQPAFVKQLTEPFACVLLEDPVAADRWQLFAAASLAERLAAIGFQPLAAETK
jgi:hypothetical protein